MALHRRVDPELETGRRDAPCLQNCGRLLAMNGTHASRFSSHAARGDHIVLQFAIPFSEPVLRDQEQD